MPTKTISNHTWAAIKKLVDAGWKLVAIERRFKGLITARQISTKKKQWEKASYRTESRYAKYRTDQYKKFRQSVLTRDNHKCIICKRGRRQVKVLQVDHIKSWSRHPELRFDPANGRTLCIYHHRRTLNYGYKANTCDDSLNGKAWEIKERMLWKKKQQEKLAKLIAKR